MQLIPRQISVPLGVLLAVIAIGTAGYVVLENASPMDALYMTVITLSTVGYDEAVPLITPAGKWFTIGLIFFGIGTFFWVVVEMAQFTIQEQIQATMGRRSVKRTLETLEDHIILCGFGRMGRQIGASLQEKDTPFVAVEIDDQAGDDLKQLEIPFLIEDASHEKTLRRAGIERANSLIACTGSDAVNVYITLTARAMRQDLLIIARTDSEEAEPKLRRAGADRIVAPYKLSAVQVANTVLRPAVVNFMELAAGSDRDEMQIEQIEVDDQSELAGKTLEEADLRNRFGGIVIAIQRNDGTMRANPEGKTEIAAGDVILVLGTKQDLDTLAEAAEGASGVS